MADDGREAILKIELALALGDVVRDAHDQPGLAVFVVKRDFAQMLNAGCAGLRIGDPLLQDLLHPAGFEQPTIRLHELIRLLRHEDLVRRLSDRTVLPRPEAVLREPVAPQKAMRSCVPDENADWKI